MKSAQAAFLVLLGICIFAAIFSVAFIFLKSGNSINGLPSKENLSRQIPTNSSLRFFSDAEHAVSFYYPPSMQVHTYTSVNDSNTSTANSKVSPAQGSSPPTINTYSITYTKETVLNNELFKDPVISIQELTDKEVQAFQKGVKKSQTDQEYVISAQEERLAQFQKQIVYENKTAPSENHQLTTETYIFQASKPFLVTLIYRTKMPVFVDDVSTILGSIN